MGSNLQYVYHILGTANTYFLPYKINSISTTEYNRTAPTQNTLEPLKLHKIVQNNPLCPHPPHHCVSLKSSCHVEVIIQIEVQSDTSARTKVQKTTALL